MKNLHLNCFTLFVLFITIVNAQNNTFPPTGNVGIGTSPRTDSKLTIKGNVNIGDESNYKLRVRHVDGKNYNDSEIGNLYLNYNTNKSVLVGWGPSDNPASDLLVSGRLGLGISNPSYHIDVVNEYQLTENFLRFRVKDASSDYFTITNTTKSPGQFIPLIKSNHVSDNRSSLVIMGQTDQTNDNGNNALVTFNARLSDISPVLTRPLFDWTNNRTEMMTMLANGNLGIGIKKPSEKLTVDGKILCEEVEVVLNVAAPDYVFEKYYNGYSNLKSDYVMHTLAEIETYTRVNHHLPEVPSAKELKEQGLELKEMSVILLQKIEELTLYTIEQEKRIKALEAQIAK